MQINKINQIDTLLSLKKHIEADGPATKTHCKVLALDFDQTLVKASSYFGSENWYQYLNNDLKKKQLPPNSHYKWAMKLANTVPYESCEAQKKISKLIKKFRTQGWSVVILTARPFSISDATMKHIKETNLPFSQSDIIYKEPSSLKKRDCLYEWLKKQQGWEKVTDLTILFADDSLPNCENIATLAEIIDRKVQVSCFHFCGASTSSEISQRQLKNLAVQLAAYQKKQALPVDCDISDEELNQSLSTLSLTQLSKEALFETMMNLKCIDERGS